MRRTLIALIALLISPALAAQPPLYTYVLPCKLPTMREHGRSGRETII